jgi:hypothetical protein
MDSSGFKVTHGQNEVDALRDYMERACRAFIPLITKYELK